MALFDVFDAVSEKQGHKTEFGDERIYGTVVGIVAENYTDEMPGRLCVNIPVRDSDANQLKWAKVAMPYMGNLKNKLFSLHSDALFEIDKTVACKRRIFFNVNSVDSFENFIFINA